MVILDRTLLVPSVVFFLVLCRVPEMDWISGRCWGLGFRIRVVRRDWVLARWASVPSSPTGLPLVPLSPWSWVVPLGAAQLEVVGRAVHVAPLSPGKRLGVWVGKLAQ